MFFHYRFYNQEIKSSFYFFKRAFFILKMGHLKISNDYVLLDSSLTRREERALM